MVGAVNIDDVKIYIKQDVYLKIEKFSKEDTSRERGGILIGDYFENNKKKNIIISAFIEAKYTDASASTLTFTHETWDYIHSEQKKLYPDKKIIGWQHTHPSYGIFLSNYDLFIHENFFNLPWQIAYVIDPIADKRGFF
ncbi:MAG: Mov34/MPN/PAD-1 family protein [Firmicutes bacterium ADurb.Bin193]|nr:MAG: Mov34/MPN/PAD-1 family protein [Firmicutes bacterium ADurb.Bin193]